MHLRLPASPVRQARERKLSPRIVKGSYRENGLQMADNEPVSPSLLAHGAEQLSLVTVETYNAELRTAGVRRVTVGTAIAQSAYGVAQRVGQELVSSGTFSQLDDGVPFGTINQLLKG